MTTITEIGKAIERLSPADEKELRNWLAQRDGIERDPDLVWIWIGSHAEYDRLISR